MDLQVNDFSRVRVHKKPRNEEDFLRYQDTALKEAPMGPGGWSQE